jgi:hypothetical protein
MKSFDNKYFNLLKYDKNGNKLEPPWFIKSKNKKKNRKKNNG